MPRVGRCAALAALLLAALFVLLAPAAANAQGVTLTYVVIPDRDADTPGVQVREGDTITIFLTALFAPGASLLDAFDTRVAAFTGTATPGTDFMHTGGRSNTEYPQTANAFGGMTSNSETYLIIDDSESEPDETIILEVPTTIGGGGTTIARDGPVTITILASDQPVTNTVNIAAGQATANEGDSVTFTVSVANAAANTDVVVPFAVTGTGANPADASDYDIMGSAADATTGTVTITAGATGAGSTEITVSITGDSNYEPEEGLQVALQMSPDVNPRVPHTALLTINESDITVGFERASSVVRENDGASQICVDVTAPAASGMMSREFSLSVSTREGFIGGAVAADYTEIANQVVGPFNDGNRRNCVIFDLTDDAIPENTEEFFLDLAPPPGMTLSEVTITPSQVRISIQDDDSITVGWTPASVTVDETAGTVVLTAAIVSPTTGVEIARDDFTVAVTTMDGDATAGSDYTALSGERLGPFGHAARVVTASVVITNDSALEFVESFTARLGFVPGEAAPVGINFSPADVTVSIVSDEVGIAFAADQAAADEGDTATFSVSLIGNAVPGSETRVPFAVTGAGASPADASDYDIMGSAADATTGTVTITADATGAGSATIALTITDDSLGEGPETLLVSLSQPQGIDFAGPSTAMLTINRSDVMAGFERTSYRVRENVGQFQVCVNITAPSLSQTLDDSFSFSVSTRDGSAGNSDYTSITNQSVGPFSNDRRQECFLVEVAGDGTPEDTENFFLDIAPPPGESLPGVVITPSQATATIEDDDSITVGWAQASRGGVTVNEASGTVVLTAAIVSPTASVAMGREFRLAVTTTQGTATADGVAEPAPDYTPLSNDPITFSDAVRSVDVEIAIATDTRVDALLETFGANLSFVAGEPALLNVGITTPTVTVVSIRDDDPIVIGFERTSYEVGEGIGQFQACVVVTTPESHQPMERSFALSVSSRDGFTGGGGGAAVCGAFSDPARDCTAIHNQIVGAFSSSRRRECLLVEIAEDAVTEPAEQFFLDLAPPPGESLPETRINPSQATVTIGASDAWRIAADEAAVTEGSTAVFSVSLTGGQPSGGMATAPFAVSGSDPANWDIVSASGVTLTGDAASATTGLVTVGAGGARILVKTNDDADYETSETVTVTLDVTEVPGTTRSATVAVDNNDHSAVVAAVSDSVSEGANATFIIELVGVAADPVNVTFEVTGAFGAGADDYDIIEPSGLGASATTGMVTLSTASPTATVVLSLMGSDGYEGIREALTLTLDISGPPAARRATVTIEDDHPSVAITADRDAVDEGDTATFTVSLMGTLTADSVATASFAVTGDDGGDADDYTIAGEAAAATRGMVVLTAAAPTATIALQIVPDTAFEFAEELTVTLQASEGAQVGDPGAATITVNTDPLHIGLERTSYTVDEDDGSVEVCAVMRTPSTSHTLPRTLFVYLAASAVPGTAGTADYAIPGDGRIGPFNNSQSNRRRCINVGIAADSLSEAAENFSVNVVVPAADSDFLINLASESSLDIGPELIELLANTSADPATATVTIGANDPYRIAADTAAVAEGEMAMFTVSLTEAVTTGAVMAVPFEVTGADPGDWAIMSGTGVTLQGGAADATMGTVLIDFGATTEGSAQITVRTTDDSEREQSETLTVTLDVPDVPGAVRSASVNIEDNDYDVTVTAVRDIVAEGETANFRVELQAGPGLDSVDANFEVTGSPGLDAADYAITAPSGLGASATTGTVTLTRGAAATISLALTGGDGYERVTETLTLAVTTDRVQRSASVAIEDTEPRATIAADRAVVDEGSTATFTVTLRYPAPGSTAEVPVVITGDAADYRITVPPPPPGAAVVTSATVTVSNANPTATVALMVVDDADYEMAEELRAELGEPTNNLALDQVSSATVTVNRSDLDMELRFEQARYSVNEGAGQPEFCAVISSPPAGAGIGSATATLGYATADGSAADGADYTAASGTLNFDDATRRNCFNVSIIDDSRFENGETFNLRLTLQGSTGVDSAVVTTGTAVVTIAANDPVRLVASGTATISEGDAAVEDTWTVAFADDNVFATAVEATWRVVHRGTQDSDFTAAGRGGTLSFAADSTAGRQFRIVVAADNLNEGDEQFSVEIEAPGVGVINSSQTTTLATIAANDPTTVAVETPARPFNEGEAPRFALNFSGGVPTAPVAVEWSITSGATAVSASPQDFGETAYPVTGRVDIAPGGERAFSAPLLPEDRDHTAEDESFTLTLTSVSGGGGGGITAAGPVTGLIAGTDTNPPQLSGVAFAGGRCPVWLVADETLAIVRPSQAANAGAAMADGAEVPGFSLRIGTGPNAVAMTASAAYRDGGAADGIRLEVMRELTAADNNVGVFAVYRYPGGDAPGIFDRALEEGRNPDTRNQLTMTTVVQIPFSVTDDFDRDGLPDAAEACLGADPLTPVALNRLPAFSSSRSGTAVIAYSGIRRFGARVHLGVSSAANERTMQAAATTLRAVYLSDTFGYDGGYAAGVGGYGCSGRFPANHAAAVADGGCEPVDWSGVIAGVSHRVGWFAVADDGFWAVDTGTVSNLPEQTLWRVPELNTRARRLFTTGANVVVSAALDAAAAETLTLEWRHIPADGAAATVAAAGAGTPPAFTATAAQAGTWQIAGLSAGANSRLYLPTTDTADYPANNEYSLGLATQTTVMRGAGGVMPVLGRPQLRRSGAVVNALAEGSAHTLHIPVNNGGMTTIEAVRTIAAADIAGLAGGVTDVAVRVAGAGGGVAAVLRYPVVAATASPLAASGDADGDGIADARDAWDGFARLPAARAPGVSGARLLHHIRAALPEQALRAGDSHLARIVTRTTVRYDDYAATRLDDLPGGLSAAYDFSVYQVNYAADGGGAAGVIIPLPDSLRGRPLSLFKYGEPAFGGTGALRPFAADARNRYGFAALQDGVCPDDVGSYYDFSATGSGDCLAVYIVDGGANDDDGAVNSVVKDPLGLRPGAATTGGGRRRHTGGFGLPALAALLLLSLAAWRRNESRRRAPPALSRK